MELPTWKGAYCPCHVNPLSMRLFNHARGEGRSRLSELQTGRVAACDIDVTFLQKWVQNRSRATATVCGQKSLK